MDFLNGLFYKFIMITAVLWIFLGYFGFTIGNIIITSIVFMAVSYVVSDLFILPRFGNGAATVADFGLAWAMIWLLGSYLFGPLPGLGTASLITASIIAFSETFFHRYLQNQVLPDPVLRAEETPDSYRKQIMAAEFGSEADFKQRSDEDSSQEEDDYRKG